MTTSPPRILINVALVAVVTGGCQPPAPAYPAPPAGSFTTETVQFFADGTSESITAARVTRDFFSQTPPMLGRGFVDDEYRSRAGTSVVMLNAAFWERRFRRSPTIIGKQVQVNDQDLTVVGIMPRGFDLPAGAQLWLPKSQ